MWSTTGCFSTLVVVKLLVESLFDYESITSVFGLTLQHQVILENDIPAPTRNAQEICQPLSLQLLLSSDFSAR